MTAEIVEVRDTPIKDDVEENLAEYSDSEEENELPLVTVGNVPREWYDDLEHLGYNLDGVAVRKRKQGDALDKFLEENPYTVYDPLMDRDVKLSKEQMDVIERLRGKRYPDAEFDEEGFYADTPKEKHPFGNPLNPPKNSFIPSKWENKAVLRILYGLQNGWYRVKKEEPKQSVYLAWNDNEEETRRRSTGFIAAPKERRPGHAESYNPPSEYVPTQEELDSWEEMDDEDRPHNFIPAKYDCLRRVPGYENFAKERYSRCLDLFLCPRIIKEKLHIDPESLVPKLPSPSALKPFPTYLAITFKGHTEAISSISISPCGQWIASGSEDHTVRIWEIDTGRCIKSFEMENEIRKVQFNPNKHVSVLAVVCEESVTFMPVFVKNEEINNTLKDVIRRIPSEEKPFCKWHVDVENYIVTIKLGGLLRYFDWHLKGDYFVTVREEAVKTAVLVHRFSLGSSQNPFPKSKGLIQAANFHPTRPYLFVATKTNVRLYDLSSQLLLKKIKSPIQWISDIAIHPSGDHIILGGYDRRVCWYDMDMTSTPYKTLKYHERAVKTVDFHSRYPLMLTGSQDGSVHIFHSMVYDDLNQQPFIVPLKVLKVTNGGDNAVTSAAWHPREPWLIAAGSDNVLRLYT